MEARAGITKRSYPSAGFCVCCEKATMVTHYDYTVPGYVCETCAPMAILSDLMLTNNGMSHPNPHQIPNH